MVIFGGGQVSGVWAVSYTLSEHVRVLNQFSRIRSDLSPSTPAQKQQAYIGYILHPAVLLQSRVVPRSSLFQFVVFCNVLLT